MPIQGTLGDLEEFKQFYLEALNRGFQAMGSSISRIVADYILRKYNLTPIETLSNPKLLAEALEKSLGYGSILVETRIIRSLRASLNLNQIESDFLSPSTIRLGHPEDFEKLVYECTQVFQKRTVR